MDDLEVVSAARRSLGAVGAKIPSVNIRHIPSVGERREAVRFFEEAGYGCAWNGEGVGGKDAFVELAVLLASTERMAFSSSITNIWAREPETAHGACIELAAAFPGRFVLGIGPGYPFQAEYVGHEYKPVANMREYLERMTAEGTTLVVPERNYARVVAANGPKMLALAGQAADGALPTSVPVSYTTRARSVLGPDKLLVIGLTVIPDDDEARAAEVGRAQIMRLAGFPGSPYVANLRRLGFTDEELTTGADRVLDAVYAYGGPARIEAQIGAHLDAGADHVILQTIVPDFAAGARQLRDLRPVVANFDS